MVARVAQETGCDSSIIEDLKRAKEEPRFVDAVAAITKAFPESLQFKGRNPLKLLYNALSQGLHAHSEDECLKIAQDIRLVLTFLAERTSQILKDKTEIEGAVDRLAAMKPNGSDAPNSYD